jgi:ribose transport system ATP-binding protein
MLEKQGDDILVRMEGIDKYYPGVHAFELKAGEVHVLLGENEAGKSTLIKILSGAERMDKGQVYVEGKPVYIRSPVDARRLGIFTIYQEFALVPQLSIAENICLGIQPVSRGLVDWRGVKQTAQDTLERLGIRLDVNLLVREVSVSEKQLTEIAKALALKGKVLILDEPTSALTEDEVANLFDVIRGLKSGGVGIIYISHKLDEVAQIGDRATVLRDGRYVGTVNVAETSSHEFITMILGKEIKEKFPRYEVQKGKRIFKAERLAHPKGKFKNVSFELYEGEVLGMAGLLGCGKVEFIQALIGLDQDALLEVELWGKRRKIRSPADAIKAGVFLLPADRKTEGLAMPLPVTDNITLTCFERYAARGLLSLSKQKAVCQELVDQLEIRTPSLATLVRYLSGGNQQKVMMARALCSKARILIFNEPTRGIDVGTKVEIYRLINQLIGQGAAVILISPELPEIIGVSDRILAWCDGEIVRTLNRGEATEELVLHLISGV